MGYWCAIYYADFSNGGDYYCPGGHDPSNHSWQQAINEVASDAMDRRGPGPDPKALAGLSFYETIHGEAVAVANSAAARKENYRMVAEQLDRSAADSWDSGDLLAYLVHFGLGAGEALAQIPEGMASLPGMVMKNTFSAEGRLGRGQGAAILASARIFGDLAMGVGQFLAVGVGDIWDGGEKLIGGDVDDASRLFGRGMAALRLGIDGGKGLARAPIGVYRLAKDSTRGGGGGPSGPAHALAGGGIFVGGDVAARVATGPKDAAGLVSLMAAGGEKNGDGVKPTRKPADVYYDARRAIDQKRRYNKPIDKPELVAELEALAREEGPTGEAIGLLREMANAGCEVASNAVNDLQAGWHASGVSATGNGGQGVAVSGHPPQTVNGWPKDPGLPRGPTASGRPVQAHRGTRF